MDNESTSRILVLSPDTVRREREIEKFFRKERLQELPRVACSSLNAARLSKLFNDLMTPNLFTGASAAHLTGVEDLGAPLVKDLAARLSRASGAVVAISGTKLPAASPLLKALSPKEVVALKALQGKELRDWTVTEFKRASLRAATDEVIERLVLSCAENPDRIALGCEQLSLYCEAGTVKVDDVRRLFSADTDVDEFELVEAVISQKYSRSLPLLDSFIRQGGNPFSLIGLLARNYAQLVTIRTMQERGAGVAQIRERMGMPEWLFQKHARSMERLPTSLLMRAEARIMIADSKLKNNSVQQCDVLAELVESLSTKVMF